MISYVRLIGVLIGTSLLGGCAAPLSYGALYVAGVASVQEVSVRDAPRVVFVNDTRVTFSTSNYSGCLAEYGLPDTDQFACSVISFSSPLPQTFDTRIRLARLAIDKEADLEWIITDRSEIVRVTAQLRPERLAQSSLWLAYRLR